MTTLLILAALAAAVLSAAVMASFRLDDDLDELAEQAAHRRKIDALGRLSDG